MNTHEAISTSTINMKNGIKLSLPTSELTGKVEKEKQVKYLNVIYRNGSKVTLNIFGEKIEVELFFDEKLKMLMFIDPCTKRSFNFLGYIENAQI